MALGILTVVASCTPGSDTAPPRTAATTDESFTTFTDVTGQTGIAFERDNGFDGESWRIVETVNGGVALLDFDGDGRLDIYFTNGRKIDPGASPPRNALYRNLGGLRFEDVSKGSGVDDSRLSLGCAVADIDGDGRLDIYVTNDGPNALYRNTGDGKFEDIATAAGLAQVSVDSGSAFFDMDGDGDLDLYVASYADDDKKEHTPLRVRGVDQYWPPLNYEGALDHLYENRGDGTFVDVSEKSGIRAVTPFRGLGVITRDFNADGFMDVYVANDMTENFMFLGDGKGQFTDTGFYNGTALGDDGSRFGSMGVDAADYDGDGLWDLVVTNYQEQPNNLYRAQTKSDYQDMASAAEISSGTLPDVAWGVVFVDLDNDGWEDLFIANGHLNPTINDLHDSTTYAQANRVYQNLRGTRFREMTKSSGEALQVVQVGRGLVSGDLDNDGDLDLVVNNSIGQPQVLRNDVSASRNWALVRLIGSNARPDAVGASVIVTAGGRSQRRERRSSSSFLSACDPRLHFGLGAAERIDRLEVHWPDGKAETHENLPAKRLLTIKHGGGVEVEEL